jgi:hypothetical protein
MSNVQIQGYPYNEPTTDLKAPVSPSWYNVGLGKIASVSTGTTNPPIPSWLVPIAGFGILLALSNTSFFQPIAIVLIGIIALWFMNG